MYCFGHSFWSGLSQTAKSSAVNDFDGVSAKANVGYMFTVSFWYMSGAEELLK